MEIEFPNWFALVLTCSIGICVIIVAFAAAKKRKQNETAVPGRSRWYGAGLMKYLLILTFIGSMGVALSNPVLKENEVQRQDVRDARVLILFDTSLSMAARPSPESKSRLEEGAEVIEHILPYLHSSEVALITFTYTPVWRVPFTRNYTYLKETLRRSLNPYFVPDSGSDLYNLLQEIGEEFEGETTPPLIILISDGEYRSIYSRNITAADVLKKAKSFPLPILSVGVGNEKGERIPIYDSNGEFTGQYERLDSGEVYISYLDAKMLRDISAVTNGIYFSRDASSQLGERLEREVLKAPVISETFTEESTKDIANLFFTVAFGSALFLYVIYWR